MRNKLKRNKTETHSQKNKQKKRNHRALGGLDPVRGVKEAIPEKKRKATKVE